MSNSILLNDLITLVENFSGQLNKLSLTSREKDISRVIYTYLKWGRGYLTTEKLMELSNISRSHCFGILAKLDSAGVITIIKKSNPIAKGAHLQRYVICNIQPELEDISASR